MPDERSGINLELWCAGARTKHLAQQVGKVKKHIQTPSAVLRILLSFPLRGWFVAESVCAVVCVPRMSVAIVLVVGWVIARRCKYVYEK